MGGVLLTSTSHTWRLPARPVATAHQEIGVCKRAIVTVEEEVASCKRAIEAAAEEQSSNREETRRLCRGLASGGGLEGHCAPNLR